MQKQKAIYIIGGGPLGLRVIEWAKELGLKAIVTDKNKCAPGLKTADESFVVDATHKDCHLQFAKKILGNYKIVGVYCGNEFGIWTVHYLSKLLNLEHNSYSSLENASDKVKMKKIWERQNIPSPIAKIVTNSKELKKIVIRLDKYFVVKPAHGSGSRGVQIVNKNSDLGKVFNNSLLSVNNVGKVLIEDYIKGRLIDANGIFINGEFYPAGILEKYVTEFPDCLPIGGNDPANLSKEEMIQVYQLLEKSSRILGITFGPVKGDFIRTDKGYQVLEIAPRFHGDVTISNTIPFGLGINPVKFYFQYLSTSEINISLLELNHKNYATWRVICLPPGELNEKLLAQPRYSDNKQITKVWYNEMCAKKIERYTDTSKIPGYICAYGKDQRETEQSLERYFHSRQYKIDVDKKHTAWYMQLGEKLKDVGFSKKSCGFIDSI